MKELWIQNLSEKDISLGDMGVRITVGNTINVYKFNSYLTEEQVKKSLDGGALANKIASGSVRIVTREPAGINKLNKITQNKEPVSARKTKSSVVIDVDKDTADVEEEAFEFADYGVENTHLEAKSGAVFVEQKEDPQSDKPVSEVNLLPMERSRPSGKKEVVLHSEEIIEVDPKDGMIDKPAPAKAPVVEPEPVVEEQEELVMESAPPSKTSVVKDGKSAVVHPPKKEQDGTIEPLVDKGKKKGAFSRADEETDRPIKFEAPEVGGMKVARKTENGVVVVEQKE